MRVNLLEYAEVRPDGSKTSWSWVTDLPLDEATVFHVMRAARSRWRIEIETFNTLKNHSYEFEHNFGHGEKNLSSVFATMCLLAFLIDQIQEHCCVLFKQAKRYQERKLYLWREPGYCFGKVKMPDWETFWRILATPGLSIEADSILDKSALDSYESGRHASDCARTRFLNVKENRPDRHASLAGPVRRCACGR